MVERGHFVELRDILHKVNGQPLSDGRRRQKLVFSATLTLPKKRRKRGKKIRHQEEGLGKCLSKVYISPCSCFTATMHLYSLCVCVWVSIILIHCILVLEKYPIFQNTLKFNQWLNEISLKTVCQILSIVCCIIPAYCNSFVVDIYIFVLPWCSTTGELMSLVGLADDAAVVDLTSRHVTADTLTEARINCTSEEKVWV